MAKSKNHTNRRKIPRSQKDVDEAEKRGYNQGISDALVMFLYTIVNKHSPKDEEEKQNFIEDLGKFAADLHDTCESVMQNYVDAGDMRRVLTDEYKIEIEFI